MANIISAINLEKSYGPRTLFSQLSTGLAQGERVGLVGPNGSGKSTLLKLLAKVEEPDQGQVVWSRNIKVGYLSQDPEFQDLTVEETVLSGSDQPDEPSEHSKVEELISRLNLDAQEGARHQRVLSLSGGQKKKVALARELMKAPDVLLLDEPTNHLDIESLLWLETFLNSQSQLTLLIVTHDRLFLQNTTQVIIDLDPKYKEGLLRIEGSYDDYLEARTLRLEGQQSQESARSNDLRREVEWLRRGAKARQTKQKARQDKAYDLMDEVRELRRLNQKSRLEVQLSAGDFVPKKLIEAKKISKAYGERVLFKDLELLIQSRSRIGLLGRNGRGKTTLIRCLVGEEKVDSGEVKWADKISVNYFEQSRDSLNANQTLLQNIAQGDYVHVHGQAVFAKSYLDRFRFRREQHDMPLYRLSGGEKARLLIAKMMLKAAPILVLDEPTNDLDIDTLDILREALQTYDGALLLVTHDRLFMEQVCDTLIAFPEPEDLLPDEIPGVVFRFESYLQWQSWKENRMELRRQNRGQKSAERGDGSAAGTVNAKKMSFKEKREFETIESVISEKESQLQALQKDLDQPENLSNSKKLLELSQTISTLEQEITKLYDRWSYLGTLRP